MRFIEEITLKRLIKSNALSKNDCAELKKEFTRAQLLLIDSIVLQSAHALVKSDVSKIDRKVRENIPLLKHGVFAAADMHKVSKIILSFLLVTDIDF
jgi:hypothetical protein